MKNIPKAAGTSDKNKRLELNKGITKGIINAKSGEGRAGGKNPLRAQGADFARRSFSEGLAQGKRRREEQRDVRREE